MCKCALLVLCVCVRACVCRVPFVPSWKAISCYESVFGQGKVARHFCIYCTIKYYIYSKRKCSPFFPECGAMSACVSVCVCATLFLCQSWVCVCACLPAALIARKLLTSLPYSLSLSLRLTHFYTCSRSLSCWVPFVLRLKLLPTACGWVSPTFFPTSTGISLIL